MRWKIRQVPKDRAERVLRGRAYVPRSVTIRDTVWAAFLGQGGFVVHTARRTSHGPAWETVAVLRVVVDTTRDRGTLVLTASRLAWCVVPGGVGAGLVACAAAVGVHAAREGTAGFWPRACAWALALAVLTVGLVALAAVGRTVAMVLAEVAALRRTLAGSAEGLRASEPAGPA